MEDERDLVADQREGVADERDRLADIRQIDSEALDHAARERAAAHEQPPDTLAQPPTDAGPAGTAVSSPGDWAGERRDFLGDDRQELADGREAADDRQRLADEHELGMTGGGATADRSAQAAALAARVLADAARVEASEAREEAAEVRAALSVSRPLTEAFLAISQALSSPTRLDEAYEQAVAHAQRLIAGAHSVSLSVRNGADTVTAAATDATADQLDQAQYASGDGPCLQSIATCEPVSSPDLIAETRWPAFTAAATAADLRSVLSTPVPGATSAPGAFGSLNNYGRAQGAFGAEATQVAILLAAHLAALPAVAANAPTEIQHLGQAVQARDVIGQAKGILMDRHGLTAEQAFDVLKAASNNLNRKLRDLADEVAFSGQLPGTPPPAAGG